MADTHNPNFPYSQTAAKSADSGRWSNEEMWADLYSSTKPEIAKIAYGSSPWEFDRICQREAFYGDRPKPTEWISPVEFAHAYLALFYANADNCPFNVALTIGFQDMGCADEFEVDEAIDCFMGRFRQWLRCRRAKPVYIMVLENARYRGLHAHMMLHIPNCHLKEFGVWFKKTTRTIGRSSQKKRSVDCVKRYTCTDLNQVIWFRYIFKGLDPNVMHDGSGLTWAETLGLRTCPPGAMTLDRVRISQTLGERERVRRGFGVSADLWGGKALDGVWDIDRCGFDVERVERREENRRRRQEARGLNDLRNLRF